MAGFSRRMKRYSTTSYKPLFDRPRPVAPDVAANAIYRLLNREEIQQYIVLGEAKLVTTTDIVLTNKTELLVRELLPICTSSMARTAQIKEAELMLRADSKTVREAMMGSGWTNPEDAARQYGVEYVVEFVHDAEQTTLVIPKIGRGDAFVLNERDQEAAKKTFDNLGLKLEGILAPVVAILEGRK